MKTIYAVDDLEFDIMDADDESRLFDRDEEEDEEWS